MPSHSACAGRRRASAPRCRCRRSFPSPRGLAQWRASCRPCRSRHQGPAARRRMREPLRTSCSSIRLEHPVEQLLLLDPGRPRQSRSTAPTARHILRLILSIDDLLGVAIRIEWKRIVPLQVDLRSSSERSGHFARSRSARACRLRPCAIMRRRGSSPRSGDVAFAGCSTPGCWSGLPLIALGRAAGFSLDEIAGIFHAGGALHIDRDMLRDKADELDGTIRRLIAMRDGLRHAAACPAPSHMECPTFRRIVRAAAIGAIKPAARNRKAVGKLGQPT